MESCDFATCRIKFKVTFAVESVSQLQILERFISGYQEMHSSSLPVS